MFGDASDPAVFVFSGSDAIYNKWTHLVSLLTEPITAPTSMEAGCAGERHSLPNNVAPLRIGFDQTGDGWNDFWKGEIDEVAFYRRPSDQQVAAHYAAALYGSNSTRFLLSPSPPSGVGNWPSCPGVEGAPLRSGARMACRSRRNQFFSCLPQCHLRGYGHLPIGRD
jgi:hypothetical protein